MRLMKNFPGRWGVGFEFNISHTYTHRKQRQNSEMSGGGDQEIDTDMVLISK